MDQVVEMIKGENFRICHQYDEPGKKEINVSCDDLQLSAISTNFIKEKDLRLWSHQHESIRLAKEGRNVCVTTSTSSGKTQIFQISAMEILAKHPGTKVLAIYPMKALSTQQVERWSDKTGLSVGKIDGDNTDLNYRLEQLNKDVLVITPDSLHAFILGNLNNRKYGKNIKDFLAKISVVVIDELHLYKGFFGTNAAYMFRRLNNVRRLIRGKNDFPQYITASATMPNAPLHSYNITGVKDFVEVGIEQDGSPARPKKFLFVESENTDLSRDEQIKKLVYTLAKLEGIKSITFLESRQRTGQMAFNRHADDQEAIKTGVFPYRSGYEEQARETITNHLEEGNFKGVISTSALEIGIDIDGLNVVIIADMPYDKNSYQQRIGRVGRWGCKGDSYVIIVRDPNSFASNLLFTEYGYNMDKALPDYEPALYLEDEEIQFVHALCHVGDTEECEYQDWKGGVYQRRMFDDGGCFPNSFTQLCNDILTGNAPDNYTDKEEKSSNPHFENSLRFFGQQYQIYDLDNNGEKVDKPISRSQLVSEAYSGAVRNTVSGKEGIIKHRVKSLDLKPKVNSVFVRKERNTYLTTKAYSRKFLIPNFKNGVETSLSCGSTGIYNIKVYEHICIWGYYEKNGLRREYKKYDDVLRIPRFNTTGILFFHPSFNNTGVKVGDIAQILYEALLRKNAFDRNDLNYHGGRLFSGNSEYEADTKFVALFDASSLNLTRKIIEKDTLKNLFDYMAGNHLNLIIDSVCPGINDATRLALSEFCQDIVNNEIIIDEKRDIQERKYKIGTKLLYHQPNENDPDEESSKDIEALFAGVGYTDDTISIIVEGNIVVVNIDDVYSIEGVTEYVMV